MHVLHLANIDCGTFNRIWLPDLTGLETKCLWVEKQISFYFFNTSPLSLIKSSTQRGLIDLSHGVLVGHARLSEHSGKFRFGKFSDMTH